MDDRGNAAAGPRRPGIPPLASHVASPQRGTPQVLVVALTRARERFRVRRPNVEFRAARAEATGQSGWEGGGGGKGSQCVRLRSTTCNLSEEAPVRRAVYARSLPCSLVQTSIPDLMTRRTLPFRRAPCAAASCAVGGAGFVYAPAAARSVPLRPASRCPDARHELCWPRQRQLSAVTKENLLPPRDRRGPAWRSVALPWVWSLSRRTRGALACCGCCGRHLGHTRQIRG